jgi:hypothetical protein
MFETNLQKRQDLNELYERFYQRWNTSPIPRMDLNQLEELAEERGFSIERLLFYRECYYSLACGARSAIAQPYPPEIFLSND